ncbi:MAG: phytanoyl-CoA dioxygenase family protein, partial [Draconibacterium sp.]|nr:phytanoyl-CoA dioxygenase family protein [Draconibacterium sp.]
MKTQLTQSQIDKYSEDGFLVIEDFLSTEELLYWRESVENAIKNRNGLKIPGHTTKLGDDDGINEDAEYYNKVFDKMINLLQTDENMKKIMLNEDLGKMAAQLAGVDGIRIWHDQALIKKPWANPTAWHLDTPFWSFHDRRALSV